MAAFGSGTGAKPERRYYRLVQYVFACGCVHNFRDNVCPIHGKPRIAARGGIEEVDSSDGQAGLTADEILSFGDAT